MFWNIPQEVVDKVEHKGRITHSIGDVIFEWFILKSIALHVYTYTKCQRGIILHLLSSHQIYGSESAHVHVMHVQLKLSQMICMWFIQLLNYTYFVPLETATAEFCQE